MKDNLSPVSAESIKARLKNEADSSAKDFDFLLLHYFIERLLYRLSISPYANNFILKGGLLLYTVLDSRGRATKDIDFLAEKIKNTPAELIRIFTEIASIPANDAVSFDIEKITAERIKENADYQGLRIKLIARLLRSRHVLQFDIGFDDVIVPHPVDITYPTILGMEAPRLKAYSLESIIAEKFQAIVYLADLNSRMKDFYDIYELSRSCDFDGATLTEAVAKAFKHRNTVFSINPMVFIDDFPLLPDKQVQWQAFQRRTGIANVPADFSVVVSVIKGFLLPVYESLGKKEIFDGRWNSATGMWRKDG
ncbi:MAG: nucleotidyl transferase AbiEii/AbiGii toxin family protein [Treponema sp.]|jgi:predicted nucleotidyltransferase component of viral defense system|nr:nucleotidyl transferase AbiEii/AbiGii toxin family protein [Treponema sp.]